MPILGSCSGSGNSYSGFGAQDMNGAKLSRAAAGFFAAVGHHPLVQHLMDDKSLIIHLCHYLCPSPSIYIVTGAVIL